MSCPRASWRYPDERVERLLTEDPEALVTDLRPGRVETDAAVREADERAAWWLDRLVRR